MIFYALISFLFINFSKNFDSCLLNSNLFFIFDMFFTLGMESTKVLNAEPVNQRFFYLIQSGPFIKSSKLLSLSI